MEWLISHVPTVKAPIKIDVPIGQILQNKFLIRMKRDRLVGSHKNPQLWKGAKILDGQIEDIKALKHYMT